MPVPWILWDWILPYKNNPREFTHLFRLNYGDLLANFHWINLGSLSWIQKLLVDLLRLTPCFTVCRLYPLIINPRSTHLEPLNPGWIQDVYRLTPPEHLKWHSSDSNSLQNHVTSNEISWFLWQVKDIYIYTYIYISIVYCINQCKSLE